MSQERTPFQPEHDPRETYVYLDMHPETGDPIAADERALNERFPVPQALSGGSYATSRRELLNGMYGPEETDLDNPQGTWFFDTEPFADQAELDRAGVNAQNAVVQEAWQNMLAGKGYTVEGQNMTGRLNRLTRKPDMGYVRVAPKARAAFLDARQRLRE